MKYVVMIPLLFLLGCLARPEPAYHPVTWGDAWAAWEVAWCDNTARCAPDWFAAHYGGADAPQAACVATETTLICNESVPDCDAPYPPDRDVYLRKCVVETESLWCGAILPPDSCFEALTP